MRCFQALTNIVMKHVLFRKEGGLLLHSTLSNTCTMSIFQSPSNYEENMIGNWGCSYCCSTLDRSNFLIHSILQERGLFQIVLMIQYLWCLDDRCVFVIYTTCVKARIALGLTSSLYVSIGLYSPFPRASVATKKRRGPAAEQAPLYYT